MPVRRLDRPAIAKLVSHKSPARLKVHGAAYRISSGNSYLHDLFAARSKPLSAGLVCLIMFSVRSGCWAD